MPDAAAQIRGQWFLQRHAANAASAMQLPRSLRPVAAATVADATSELAATVANAADAINAHARRLQAALQALNEALASQVADNPQTPPTAA